MRELREKSDHRLRRQSCPRVQRPRCSCAREPARELPPSHPIGVSEPTAVGGGEPETRRTRTRGFARPAAAGGRLRLERLDPTVVIGHVGAVHGAQRNSHRRRDRRLRHPALAQQYHLDALTLCRWDFPPQRRLQFPYLAFAAFDHRFPRISGQSESHRLPNACVDLTRYGSGISQQCRRSWLAGGKGDGAHRNLVLGHDR